MLQDPDIRWKQRFQSFSRVYALLDDALKEGPADLSPLEKEGVIQRFEYTFELGWKTVKDYLEAGGSIISPVTPRQVLKNGFAAKILRDGHVWMAMLDHRNMLSHTYDLNAFAAAVEAINDRYLPALADLHGFFAVKSSE